MKQFKQVSTWFIAFALVFSNCTAPEAPEPPPAGEPFSIQIGFGYAEQPRESWTGSVTTEDAQVTETKGWQFRGQDRISLNTFELRTAHPRTGLKERKGLLLNGSARPGARISVATNHGDFSFRLIDAERGEQLSFLGGDIQVTGLLPVEKLTDDLRDDDYPSIAVLDEKTAWAVWQSYSGLSDEIRLSKYDENWRTFTRVPGVSGDVWRPQLALDAEKLLWVVWSQQVDGNFDLYARALNEKTNSWQELIRLSTHPNPDIDHHLIADSRGHLWVVWQGFHGDNSDIFLSHYDGQKWSKEVTVTDDPANDWEPRVAVDDQGGAHVVWDTYRNGNYDVYLRQYADGKLGPQIAVADTAKFEAHATVAVDTQGRVWVAWDEGGVNWAKDTGATDDPNWLENGQETWDNFLKTGASSGTNIYDTRIVNLVVFDGGQRKVPAHDFSAAMQEQEITGQDYPQLFVDPTSGRIGLIFHRWTLLGKWIDFSSKPVAVWEHAAIFYEEDRWSSALTMPESGGRPSMRLDAAFATDGSLWTIWASDGRLYQASEYQPAVDNVYTARVPLERSAVTPRLEEWEPQENTEVPASHPDEASNVARIRSYRTNVHGSRMQIVRGDLHRHSEFSWDNGGLRDGSLFDIYRYMLDAAALDFGAVTDHNAGGDYEYWWWLTEKSCDLYNVPQAFTTFYGYERSVLWPGGHRNIIHTRRGVPIVSFFTGTAFRRPRPGVAVGARQLVENDTKLLYESLHQSNGLSIPHTPASVGGTDWSDSDPEVEPVVEIFQGCRLSYEHPGAPRAARSSEDFDYREDGFVWNAYRKGYRIGTIASSDHWSTHISYAMVYTEKPTREAIFEAIKRRRTYGATDNIVLDYRIGQAFMGEDARTSRVPVLKIRVIGTDSIARLDIIKNEQLVYSGQPGKKEVNLTYLDKNASPGTSYYYVRVIQDDWEMAWGSPIWVEYQP